MFGAPSPIDARIKTLQSHLERENPILLDVVKSFRQLDRVAYGIGMLSRDESFATKVPWWPMISILGTFSSGKSTFINEFVGQKLQNTGNQAVDDKFTVVCYGNDQDNRVLPGRALDADPRFPFYQMSAAIEESTPGEGERIDVYLQLKTARSEALQGKILIDSPGFDADEQRNSTLRITDRIIDLSDLVLVFFDARHPEPGAMQDTLEHLVSKTISRPDSNKFLYILNQIDNAAREDNPEEVFAAWQRALAQKGLTAGRFYSIYSLNASVTIEDPKLRQRFESKRATDMAEIETRMQQVEVERAYRIIGVLEHTAKTIQDKVIPTVREARERWRRRAALFDAIIGIVALAGFFGYTFGAGHWDGLSLVHPWYLALTSSPTALAVAAVILIGLAGYTHFTMRKLAARMIRRNLATQSDANPQVAEWIAKAFERNVKPSRLALGAEPAGWGRLAKGKVTKVLADANRYIQELNNRFTDPSGTDASVSTDAGTAGLPPAPADTPSLAPPVDYVDKPVGPGGVTRRANG